MREIAKEDPHDSFAMAQIEVLEAEEPPVDHDLNWIWRAWWRLSADRPHLGGGLGPAVPCKIPFGAVKAWAEWHGLSRGDFEVLDVCFAAMDTAFIEHWRSMLPREGKHA